MSNLYQLFEAAIIFNFYASVGGAPRYTVVVVCESVCLSVHLSVCISKSRFSTTLENSALKLVLQVKHAILL